MHHVINLQKQKSTGVKFFSVINLLLAIVDKRWNHWTTDASSHTTHILSTFCVYRHTVVIHVLRSWTSYLQFCLSLNLEYVGECCKAQWVCVHQKIALYKCYPSLLLHHATQDHQLQMAMRKNAKEQVLHFVQIQYFFLDTHTHRG